MLVKQKKLLVFYLFIILGWPCLSNSLKFWLKRFVLGVNCISSVLAKKLGCLFKIAINAIACK